MFSTRHKEAKDVSFLSRFGLLLSLFFYVRGKLRFARLSQVVMWWRNGKKLILETIRIWFCGLTNLLLPKKKKKAKCNQPGAGERGSLNTRDWSLLTPGCSCVDASLWKEPCVCDSVVCSLVLCDHVWQVCGEKKTKQKTATFRGKKNEISPNLREAKKNLYIGKQHCW